jgi:hypothetical protein
MNTNNLYEKVNLTEQINYQELYAKNDKKNNPEQIFNLRFSENINILRQPAQTVLENKQIFNNNNNYDATKNYYNRYQNNYINQSLMNCEEGSGVGNFAVFNSDPNSNNFINSLTNNNQQPQQQQQSQQQQQPQQQPQQPQQRPQQPQQRNQQQNNQQKCDYCIKNVQNKL